MVVEAPQEVEPASEAEAEVLQEEEASEAAAEAHQEELQEADSEIRLN